MFVLTCVIFLYLQEKQAKFAAQRLFEKLNIKMEPYNPEGDSYMKYRDQRDEEDGID